MKLSEFIQFLQKQIDTEWDDEISYVDFNESPNGIYKDSDRNGNIIID